MRQQTKKKVAGDNVIFRLKKDENEKVIEWMNSQSNINDALRFLVELEVARNGIIDYGTIIPNKRDETYLRNYLRNQEFRRENSQVNYQVPVQPQYQESVEKSAQNASDNERTLEDAPTTSSSVATAILDQETKGNSIDSFEESVDINEVKPVTISNNIEEVTNNNSNEKNQNNISNAKDEERKKKIADAAKVWGKL